MTIPNILGITIPEWVESAVCAQVGGDDWFPEKGASRSAKTTCAVCPVRDECLDWAIANDERFGIWAGLTYRERKAVAKERAA